MTQLSLLPELDYDKTQPITTLPADYYGDDGVDWERCFKFFVNFFYGLPEHHPLILSDYREEFWQLTRVWIVVYVLDGGVE